MTAPPSGPDGVGDSAAAGSARRRSRGLFELAFKSLTRAGQVGREHTEVHPRHELPRLNLADPAEQAFGDYQLLEWLGEGGTGAVYRARHIPLEREVAIKLLAAEPWASADFIARFEREAQNAARMQHPNIVTVFEAGTHDGVHFFSMRLVEGRSLSALLKRGERFAPRAAASLLQTVAEAVAYAHSLGVLHLDLKPGNILIDAAGQPHVADFGLARRPGAGLVLDNDEVSGTPAYMAPEQTVLHAQPLTAATDVWGLGAILYEVVTGHAPFLGVTAQATLDLVVRGQVRAPRRWKPGLPLDLQAIVLRCLRKDPAERYPSARALADDLARFAEGRPVQARPLHAWQRIARWTRREPRLAATGVLAFALLIAGLLATAQQWRRADASSNAARENLWATRARTAQNVLAEGDGFRGLRPLVANLADMQGARRTANAEIERQRIGTILANAPQLIDLVRLPAGELATSIAISPDGRHFAVATAHGNAGASPHHVRQFETATLRETWSAVADNLTFLMAAGDSGAPLSGLHYTPDGRYLVVSLMEQPSVPAPRWCDMIAFDVRDGRVLWPGQLPERQADIIYDDKVQRALVRFRSDMSLRWPDSAQFYEVDHWRPIGPRHTVATTLAADLWLPAPAGDTWLGTRDSAHFTLYDVPGLKPRWQLRLPQTSLVRAWQFSHDGRWIALGSVDGGVRLVAAADGRVVDLGSGPAERVLRVAFSADDGSVAALDDTGRLWIWEVATGLPRSVPLRVVQGDASATLLRFAGDGVFAGGLLETGHAELGYVALPSRAAFNNAGVPGTVRVQGTSVFGMAFDVSPSTRRLVSGADGGLVQVWALPSSPLLAARAAPMPAAAQTFDGVRVVAVDGATVRVVDAVTGGTRSPPLDHPEPVRFAELSPDGRTLVTIAGRTVRIVDTGSWRLRGPPIVLPQTPQRAAFADTAQRIVLTTAAYEGDVLRERIHLLDLARAVALPAASVDFLTDFVIDARARRALGVSWNSSTHARSTPRRLTLATGTAGCVPALGGAWRSFALAPDGRSAWFASASEQGLGLQRWDLDACRKIAATALPGVASGAVLQARGNGVVVHRGGKQALIRIDPDGKVQAAVGEVIPGAMHAFAMSADGGRMAIATRNAVHLLDAQGGRWLSAALGAPIAGDDGIARLAFSPDGTRLLARTINGRWLLWNLPRTGLDVAALARLVRVLDRDAQQRLADAEIQALRVQLRPTAPPASVPARAPAAAIRFAAATDAGVDRRFVPLDLRPATNIPLIGSAWPEPYSRGDRPTLAPGLQRFLGVDYRVEGGVHLSGGGTTVTLGPELHHSAVVPVAGVVASRVHVLAFMDIPMQRSVPPRPFARVVLIGADGRETALEIRTVRDVVTDMNPDHGGASARIAFAGVSSAIVRGGASTQPASQMYAVTLTVPSGTGPIVGLRFDEADEPMEAPLFYAATLERAPASERRLGQRL